MQTITLDQLRATVQAGGVKGLTLTGQGSGFYLHVATRAGYQAVLVKSRSAEPRRFGNPVSALMVMKELGIGVAQVEISRWDPDQQEIGPQKVDVRAAASRDAHPGVEQVQEVPGALRAATRLASRSEPEAGSG